MEFGERESLKLSGGYFWASTPVHASAGEGAPDVSREKSKVAERLLKDWYTTKARLKFPEIAAPYFARFAELGYQPSELVIKWMDKRWGSCTAGGKLILNTDLVRAPRGCIEYVIVHELCHLVYLDYGKQLRALQAQEFPEWRKYKQLLEERMA